MCITLSSYCISTAYYNFSQQHTTHNTHHTTPTTPQQLGNRTTLPCSDPQHPASALSHTRLTTPTPHAPHTTTCRRPGSSGSGSGTSEGRVVLILGLTLLALLASAVTIGGAMSADEAKDDAAAGETQSGPLSAVPKGTKLPVTCPDTIMDKKAHGTCVGPLQKELRWGCDAETADRICCFNRHYAEHSGYWTKTRFLSEANKTGENFYDPVTGKLLFQAPRSRSWAAFVKESRAHGWPSFRDDEVNWENVRCLSNGECVSVDGTHLGHNLPDRSGNRYCINLVSVSGRPAAATAEGKK